MASATTSKSGPSAEQWEYHRALIISTYMNNSLKTVQDVMEKQHDFKASKRMYDTQFKKWKVSKNQKSHQKDNILAAIDSSTLLNQNFTGNRTDDRKLRNLVRYMKTKQRKEGSRSHLKYARPGQPSPMQVPTFKMSPPQDTEALDLSPQTEDYAITPEPLQSISSGHASLLAEPTVYTPFSGHSPYSVSSSEQQYEDDLELINPDPNPSDMTSLFETWSTDPAIPLLVSDPLSTKTFTIMKSISGFVQWQLHHGSDAERLSTPHAPASDPNADLFWINLKHGINLLKQGEMNTAGVALSGAGNMIDNAVTVHTTPFTFVLELLTTLSQVNTRTCPRVRRTFIQWLSTGAHRKLGPMHPISLICHNLQTELMIESHHTCDRILFHYLELVSASLGKDHPVTFKSQRAAVALLRRDRQFVRATHQGTSLLTSTRTNLGKGSSQARAAATELAHVHMDEKKFAPAIALCSEIIGLNDTFDTDMVQISTVNTMNQIAVAPTNGMIADVPLYPTDFPGPIFRDTRSVHTMEDLAKIYDQLGQKLHSVSWLAHAAELAVGVWGASHVVTVHIVDKLCGQLKACGRSETEIGGVRKRYDGSILDLDIPSGEEWVHV